MLHAVVVLALCVYFGSLCFETRASSPAPTGKPPEIWFLSPLNSLPAPASTPHHRDCKGVSCSEPLTSSLIGYPCGCAFPIRVVVDLAGAPYVFFAHIPEFELQVAAGTFLKQRQVKITTAIASIRDPGKTRVTIDLVPLGLPLSPPPIHGAWAGSGPEISGAQDDPVTANVSPSKFQKLNAGIILVIAFSSFIVTSACVIFIILVMKWRKIGESPISLDPPVRSSLTTRPAFRHTMSNNTERFTNASLISTMATYTPVVEIFSLAELEKATDQFSPKNILGKGGFGCVYHGQFEDGSDVAVKLLTRKDQNRDHQFIAEIEILSRLHHRNLVKLVGVCIEKKCLVYELIRNGSIESHLRGADKDKCHLDWDTRMKIALGAARGLAYLHEDSDPHVIHRGFKASNILLEEDFTPKITDFGLAREESKDNRDISTRIVGTFGYVAPEYIMAGHLLVKSDVYSYGVVLLELLSGRKPVHKTQSGKMENLVTLARPFLASREGVEQLLVPSLVAENS